MFPRLAVVIVCIMLSGLCVPLGAAKWKLPYNTLMRSFSSKIPTPPDSDVATPGVIRSDVDSATVVKLNESVVFEGYRNILRREYMLPNGKPATYDILTQRHLSVVVFTWNTTSSTTTLIREYHPGPEQFMYGTVAGMYESSKHTSPLKASQLELEEEAHLQTERWIPLLENTGEGMSFDKYSTNRFFPYLALDCHRVETPRPPDDDELISVEYNVPYSRVLQLMHTGQMNVVSTYAVMLGVRKLREMGIKVDE
jgi:hypothetical protein